MTKHEASSLSKHAIVGIPYKQQGAFVQDSAGSLKLLANHQLFRLALRLHTHAFMCRTKLTLLVFATCLALSVPLQSAASSIVDTGTPSGSTLWGFHSGQYFAGEFTIGDTHVIQTIEGYFDNHASGFAGAVDIAIHADGGDIPGAILFMATTPEVAAFAPLGWYGVSGLNQLLTPGTYWASFNPSSGLVNGSMPGFAPNPLSHYANNLVELNHVWNGDDTVGIGLRINYEPVPDSTSTLTLLIAVALLGSIAQRLRM